jgi:N-methylhydantoinase B
MGMIGSKNASPFMVNSFHSGGAGARPSQDGLSATPYPSGVRNVPVEATEAITPIVIWRKEFRQNSGGPGRYRGGLGQVMEIENREEVPFGIFATFERVHYPPRGRAGGSSGAKGRISLAKEKRDLRNKGFQIIPAGERLVIEMPGGGGIGVAFERDPSAVAADVKAGFITIEAASTDYGVVVRDDGQVDFEATKALRM